MGDADVEDGLVDASKHGEMAVIARPLLTSGVVSGSRDAVAAFEDPRRRGDPETDARQGAHSPLAADAAAAYDALLVRALAGAAERGAGRGVAHPGDPRRGAGPGGGGCATDARSAAGDASLKSARPSGGPSPRPRRKGRAADASLGP